MSKIMRALRDDHGNAGALLSILETEMARFAAAEHADYDLIRTILLYFGEYPDCYHHPLEDLVYTRLRMRDGAAAERVGDLAREHETLADARRRFADAMDKVLADVAVPRHRVAVAAREYIDLYRRHMEREEAEFFPAAEATLDPEDWNAVAAEADRPDDPLLGAAGARRYHALRESIRRIAGC